MGPEWLVAATIPGLGGLALAPSDDTAPGAHWEVGETVIDNGRVRAELDAAGRLARLCCDGVFAELTGPALEALVDGVPWSAPMSVFVAEDGPVRARVIASGGDAKGTLSIAYTLIAGEDCLRITASWSGDAWCELDIPTAHRASDLHLGAGLARWNLVQRITALGDGSPAGARGVRWAALGDASGRGLAIVAGRPIAVAAQGGHVYLPLAPSVTVALAAARRQPGALSLSHLSEHLAASGRRVDAEAPPPPIRMAETAAVVPLWARRGGSDAGRDDGELLLAETAGARGRIHLYPPAGVNDGAACWRVDAHGRRLAPIGTTPEGDGWQVDLAPGEVCLVRWTAPPTAPIAEELT